MIIAQGCYPVVSDVAIQRSMIAEIGKSCAMSFADTSGFIMKVSRDKDGNLVGLECLSLDSAISGAFVQFCKAKP